MGVEQSLYNTNIRFRICVMCICRYYILMMAHGLIQDAMTKDHPYVKCNNVIKLLLMNKSLNDIS